jgi:hypothetical protein
VKLTVVIPSRGRPFHLIKAIRLLHSMASGLHQVTYAIGCDADDPKTLGAAYTLMIRVPGIQVFCTKRLGSLGEMANIMAARYPADVYCSLCDDVDVLTKDWDNQIYLSWAAKPDGLWWWRTLQVRPATYAIVSHKWMQAAGRIFTDYFPFWWDDVWLMQVWNMATGIPAVAVEAFLDDKPFATHRMRDLLFWADFYTSRKGERREQAAAIVKALGWPEVKVEDTICDVRPEFLAQANQIEHNQGEKSPPTQEYLAAKRRAELIMAGEERMVG